MLQVHGSNAADTLHFQQIIFHVHDKHPGNPVTASQAGATIRSPGLVLFSSSISTPITARTYPRDLLCELLLPTVGGLVPCRVNVSLGPKRLGNGEVARWSLIGDA